MFIGKKATEKSCNNDLKDDGKNGDNTTLDRYKRY